MDSEIKHFEAKLRNFQSTPNGVRWEAVIFSSEFNRNAYYFDIYKLLRWKNRLNAILFNNKHDGKYFSYTTDKLLDIKVSTDDNGITECYAIIESTNPEKRANPEMVTGFSIEISVKPENVIKNENGEFYTDFEWVGIAYLMGELAGSGGSRLIDVKTFSKDIKTYPKILDMDKQELTAILEEALKPIMTAIDTLAITLQGLVDKMPEIQTEPKKEMSLEVTKDNQIGDMPDIQPAVDTMPTDQVLPDGEMLPTDVEKEKEKEKEIEVCIEVAVSKAVEYALKEHGIIKSNDELTQIENSFNNISNLKTFMKQASNEELVAEPQATGITTNDGELKKYNRNDAVKNVKNIYNN